MLPQRQQLRVFDAVPPNTMLIVVSQMLLKSITIPGIKYVVDPGREKTRMTKGRALQVRSDWVSQRLRLKELEMGRTGPDIVIAYTHLQCTMIILRQQLEPEILGRPIEDLILNMKLCT